ncbi:MAG: hypothetical protein ACAI44_31410, partial [Candidatus Sericytochromatia bacterium]
SRICESLEVLMKVGLPPRLVAVILFKRFNRPGFVPIFTLALFYYALARVNESGATFAAYFCYASKLIFFMLSRRDLADYLHFPSFRLPKPVDIAVLTKNYSSLIFCLRNIFGVIPKITLRRLSDS